MATPSQLVHMAFAAGINESQRDEVLDPMAGMLKLENVRHAKRGGVSKRYGYDALTRVDMTNTSITTGRRLFASNTGAPLLSSGRLLHEYSETAAAWSAGLPMSDWTVREQPVASPSDDSSIEDVEVCNGYVCVAYGQASGSYATVGVYDAATYAPVAVPEVLVSADSHILVSTHGNYFIAVHVGTPNLTAYYLDTTSFTTLNTGWVSIGTLATDCGAVGADVCALGDRIGVAYMNNSGGTARVSVLTADSTGTLETTTVTTGTLDADSVACDGASGGTFFIAFDNGTTIKVMGFDPTDLTTVPATVGNILSVTTGATSVHVKTDGSTSGMVFAQSSSSDMQFDACKFVTTGGVTTASGSTARVYNARLDGSPMLHSSRYYVQVQPADADQGVWTLCDADDVQTSPHLVPVVHAQNALALATTFKRRKVPLCTGTTYCTGLTVRKNGLTARASHVLEIEGTNATALKGIGYGGALVMTGGVVQSYDGARVSELGFLARPPQPTVTDQAGSLNATTGFLYAAVYEEIDAAGNVHVSGVSDPSDSTGALTGRDVVVTVKNLTVSRRLDAPLSNVRIALYRTTDGGSVYYRHTELFNSTAAASQNTTDTTTDATLSANAKLYRHPGLVGTSLDRRPFPHASAMTEYNGMLAVASESSVQHSGQLVSGEAPWTNPVFELPIPGPGDVTALASQDGTLFVFKRRAVYAVAGEPPADNGSGGGFGTPRRLATDVGCIEPRSVVVTALGVFFQSERGLEILTRAGSVEFIGEAIGDTVASYPVCTAAVLDAAASLVRFEMVDSEPSNVASGNGVSAVYDLNSRLWSSIDKRTNYASTASRAAQDATMVRLSSSWAHAWIDSGGYVYTEASDSVDADGSWVTMLAQTAWVKTGGLQGQQIVNGVTLLAQKTTDLNLAFQLGYDFRPFETARTYTHTETAQVVSDATNLQLHHEPHNNAMCAAVSVKLTDATPTSGTVGDGTGAVWVGLTFAITPRPEAALTHDGSR